MKNYKLAIVGATGVVGRKVLEILANFRKWKEKIYYYFLKKIFIFYENKKWFEN